jgi:pyruvate ferredoxin oxidoreductase alpha subunit
MDAAVRETNRSRRLRQAFRLAEGLSMPVMVCVDGSSSHAGSRRIDIPDQADVDAFCAYDPVRCSIRKSDRSSVWWAYAPSQAFSPALQTNLALRLLPDSPPSSDASGARSGGLLRTYRADDAECSSSPWDRSTARSRTPSTKCGPTAFVAS